MVHSIETAMRVFGLRQNQAAALVGVTPRAMGMWLSGERGVPGPVQAYFELLLSLPEALQNAELGRRLLEKEAPVMADGIYGFEVRADPNRCGRGTLFLENGRIKGADEGGVRYDGTYTPVGIRGDALMKIRVTIPAGTELVQGGIAPQEFSYDIEETVNLSQPTKFPVWTPIGGSLLGTQVTVSMKKLRD